MLETGFVDLRVGVGVEGDTSREQVFVSLAEGSVASVETIEEGSLRPESCYCHEVFGEGSCLVAADVVGSSHSLAGREVSYQVLLVPHLPNTIGERDSDSKRETLGHSHDHDTHSNNEILN